MPEEEVEKLTTWYCERCNQTMNVENFYRSNNTEKYPDRYLNLCKNCLTAHLDNFDPDTYLWILQELDIPYIPDEWTAVLRKYAHDKDKLTGKTVLGRYISKMKLKKWKDYRWADTEYLQELENNRVQTAMKRQGYSAQDIDNIINSNNAKINVEDVREPDLPPIEEVQKPISEEEEFLDDLTEEDRKHLRLKWGSTYKPAEWVALEQLYLEMMESYDIQTAGDKNTLILACKASLKANQLLNLGDIEGAQKATKMYDSLMKSGKWTAAQNKIEENEGIDSIGALVALCERDGFIPRYYTDGPQDKVDKVLLDNQKYVHDLVTEELGLGTLIENAIKNIEIEKEQLEANDSDSEIDEDELFTYDKDVITDKDFSDFNDFQYELELADEEES